MGKKNSGGGFDTEQFEKMLEDQANTMKASISAQMRAVDKQMAQSEQQHLDRMQLLQDQMDADKAEAERKAEEERIKKEQQEAGKRAAEQADKERSRAKMAKGRRSFILTGGSGVTEDAPTKKNVLMGGVG